MLAYARDAVFVTTWLPNPRTGKWASKDFSGIVAAVTSVITVMARNTDVDLPGPRTTAQDHHTLKASEPN